MRVFATVREVRAKMKPMTTFTDRPNRALLVIDVQVDVVQDAYRREEVIANVATLVDKARATRMPVIWIQHNDEGMPINSDAWQLVPELTPQPGEPHIDKQFRSSFVDTNLEATLADLGIGSLVICGAQTNNCVRHTVHSALDFGYDVTLVEDAHTTSDFQWDSGLISAARIIDEQNASSLNYALPGRTCTLATTEETFA